MASTTYNTCSINFPNMLDVSRNQVAVAVDNASVTNRCRLLILSDPTEMSYDIPFGVGLTKYLFQYNNENTKARIKQDIIDKLAMYEPKVNATETQFADGLLFTGSDDPDVSAQQFNELKMTVGLKTIYGDKIDVRFEIAANE